jgi:hypothetical protein
MYHKENSGKLNKSIRGSLLFGWFSVAREFQEPWVILINRNHHQHQNENSAMW